MVIDLIHMPIVLALLALGASKWNGPVYVGVISVIAPSRWRCLAAR
jgi:hypothetical protein